jgi:hypothetical protein
VLSASVNISSPKAPNIAFPIKPGKRFELVAGGRFIGGRLGGGEGAAGHARRRVARRWEGLVRAKPHCVSLFHL